MLSMTKIFNVPNALTTAPLRGRAWALAVCAVVGPTLCALPMAALAQRLRPTASPSEAGAVAVAGTPPAVPVALRPVPSTTPAR